MSDAVEQRWATVPAKQWTLRTVPLAWARGDAALVEGFVGRQERFGGAVLPWVTERAGRYRAQWEHSTAEECRREAMLDLICWQRQERNAATMVRWLRGWEAAVRELEQKETKGTKA